MKQGACEKYLRHYSAVPRWPLKRGDNAPIRRSVVIPALAESPHLFYTLASLADNPLSELQQTLVICVVNNHAPPLAAPQDITDNRKTIETLDAFIVRREPFITDPLASDAIRRISRSGLRLAYVDASSPGHELPATDGGVGTARKIGMDHALALMEPQGSSPAVICCLDADTLVEQNYLAAVDRHFFRTANPAAVAAYAHHLPEDRREREAICSYELFLRAYVMGLAFTGSPYAYHAIGSTMACTADAYLAVRGMNRRGAAEDFHFLNKLAKLGKIETITETTVFPSARLSQRVPFGTGRRMIRSLNKYEEGFQFYDPRIFKILAAWLAAIGNDADRDSRGMIIAAGECHSLLAEFLLADGFDRDWELIRRHAGHPRQRSRQFHGWFDALRTLRAIHHLQRAAFPPLPLYLGVGKLLEMVAPDFPGLNLCRERPGREDQERLLVMLRMHYPCS